MRMLERLLGSREIVRPRASPDDLEGFARDLREAGTLRRRERLPRGCLRFVEPIFADRGVSGERVDARDHLLVAGTVRFFRAAAMRVHASVHCVAATAARASRRCARPTRGVAAAPVPS